MDKKMEEEEKGDEEKPEEKREDEGERSCHVMYSCCPSVGLNHLFLYSLVLLSHILRKSIKTVMVGIII